LTGARQKRGWGDGDARAAHVGSELDGWKVGRLVSCRVCVRVSFKPLPLYLIDLKKNIKKRVVELHIIYFRIILNVA